MDHLEEVAESCRGIWSLRKVRDAIRSLMNSRYYRPEHVEERMKVFCSCLYYCVRVNQWCRGRKKDIGLVFINR